MAATNMCKKYGIGMYGVLVFVALGCTSSLKQTRTNGVQNALGTEQPLLQCTYLPSFDANWIDKTKNPCEDFYEYACTHWQKQHPLTPELKEWTFVKELSRQNEQYLWGLLLEASHPKPTRTANEQKLGDAFAACMNEDLLEKTGLSSVQEELNQIKEINNFQKLAAFLGRADRSLPGSGLLWGFYVGPDAHDASHHLFHFSAIGLGLPNRNYYLELSQEMQEKRTRYKKHIESILQLAGASARQAAENAEKILQLETRLAQSLLSPQQRRDPLMRDHPLSWEAVKALLPSIDLDDYMRELGLKADLPEKVNVEQPDYFKALEQEFKKNDSLSLFRVYLTWKVLDGYAPFLHRAFREANFQFYSVYLKGVKAQEPRWRKCVGAVASKLRDAMGPLFVQKTFSPDAKAEITEMVGRVKAVLRGRLQNLSWMQADTRTNALRKLDAMIEKIAYPEQWRDTSALTIAPDAYVGNLKRINAFETDWHLARIRQSVDRAEWLYPVSTINAFYEAKFNAITLLAGYLQSPFYDKRMLLPVKYGSLAYTIGHEYIHGFDDSGRRYDADGQLRDWWAPADAQNFEKRSQCTLQQYSQYKVQDTAVNGQLTLGENIADLGGLSLAFEAWSQVAGSGNAPQVDGFTPDQQFFLGFAFRNCENVTPDFQKYLLQNDTHSLGKQRVNGVLSNMPEFHKAFSCRLGQPMVRENRCQIW